jgi:glucokinase
MPDPSSPPLVLAGDLGGTNFRVAVFSGDAEMTRLHFAKFRSAEYRSLEEMVRLFLASISPNLPPETSLEAACFGVPGPNVAGVVVASNLGWKIDTHALPGFWASRKSPS